MRVLLADDHPLVVAGIGAAVLTPAAGFEIVGTAHDGRDVLPLIERVRPDVVLLDVHMPGLDGIACLTRVRARFPDLAVVMLSAATAPLTRDAALAAGATDYVTKSVDLGDLPPTVMRAVGRARAGRSGAHRSERGLDLFTEREVLVLRAIADGLSNRQIADSLQISIATVKFHLANVYRKLGVANRTAAARWAAAAAAGPDVPEEGDERDGLRSGEGDGRRAILRGAERDLACERRRAAPRAPERLGPPARRT